MTLCFFPVADEADGLRDGLRRILLEAECERQVEERLGIG